MRLVRRRICLQSPPDSTVGVGPKTILVQLEAPELHQNEILVQLDRPGVEKKLPSCTKIPVDPIAEIPPGLSMEVLPKKAKNPSVAVSV